MPRPLVRLALTAGLILALPVLGMTAPRPAVAAQEPAFRAGAHAEDVTPRSFPISMNGQMQDQVARKAFDRLHARALVLDDGRAAIAMVVVDSCLIDRELMDEAKRRAAEATGIPASRMLISATHSHTAPAVVGVFQTEPDVAYRAFLTERIAAAVAKAHANREPAQVGWGLGRDAEMVHSRRWLMKPGKAIRNAFGGTVEDRAQMHPGNQNPDALRPTGPIDPAIGLLSVRTPEGRPIAMLANYGMHYVGVGIEGGTCSADYFGRFCGLIEKELGTADAAHPFVAILGNGTSGESYCQDLTRPRQAEKDLDHVAASVAKNALDAYRQIEHRPHAPIVMRETLVRLGRRLPGADELSRAKALYDTVKAEGRPARTLDEIYAREAVLLAAGKPDTELKLQAIRVGDLGIAAIPCEVYAETGLALRAVSPMAVTFTLPLANGYDGYLPPPEQFPLGGYTTWRARSSCLEPLAEPKIKATLSAMLSEVARAVE
jgi:hypothetical protein